MLLCATGTAYGTAAAAAPAGHDVTTECAPAEPLHTGLERATAHARRQHDDVTAEHCRLTATAAQSNKPTPTTATTTNKPTSTAAAVEPWIQPRGGINGLK